MGEIVTTELRSFLTQYKDIVSIKLEESYRLVTISNKGIIHLRNIVHGVEIKGDTAYRIKAGSFIYSRLAAHTGSFGLVPPELDGAIVTSEMPVFEIDQDIILSDYLIYLLRQKKFLNILFQLTKGMGRVRIKEESLLNIKLLIHKDIADQKRVIDSLDSKFENIEDFDNTHSEQIEIINQARQVFLQEAIEGKLTAKWRREHPAFISGDNHASKLLEKIKSERDRLVKEGKVRKEKPLTPIADNEKPFDIPEGWVWCRLGEIAELITKGSSPNWQGIRYVEKGKGIRFITSKNVDFYKVDLSKETFVEDTFNKIEPRSILQKGDILTNIVGASIGRTAIYELEEISNINQAVCLIRISSAMVNKMFLLNWMNSTWLINKMHEDEFAPGRANLSMSNVANFVIPLSPFFEQQVIVKRIDKLMAMIDELEKQVSERKEKFEMLMQSVLREAFVNGD